MDVTHVFVVYFRSKINISPVLYVCQTFYLTYTCMLTKQIGDWLGNVFILCKTLGNSLLSKKTSPVHIRPSEFA